MKKWFYGIYGIEFIYHGDWGDPELIWYKKSFNYYDLETPLWDDYNDECNENNTTPTDEGFCAWIKNNAYLAREYLQNLMDCKCFYGGREAQCI